MLELQDITYTVSKGNVEFPLIYEASLRVPRGHFMAIVGPSGCGKTTLLKIISGIHAETRGSIHWCGRDLAEEGDFEPSEIGYVPQFSIAHDYLTVEESVENAVQLRVCTNSRQEVYDLADAIIDQAGLDSVRENLVKVLSGGQKRRLGLALELVSNPLILLCDEVTSGLDPKSEREIVHLLHHIAETGNRIVVSVTHSLRNLELYDSVLVLHEGRIVYHGPPRAIDHYFSVDEAEEIYPRLAKRMADEWHESWKKYRERYYESFPPSMIKGAGTVDAAAHSDAASSGPVELPDFSAQHTIRLERAPAPPPPSQSPASDESPGTTPPSETTPLTAPRPDARRHSEQPGAIAQFLVLSARRWKIFLRDRTQLILHLAILLGFPLIVIIFASKGVDPIHRLSETIHENPQREAEEQFEFFQEQLTTGSLVSGLVMFQVVLLTLMGSNNSAREIAGERLLFEKEKLAGLRPLSYLGSKLSYLAVLVGAQSVWMAVFVQTFCRIPVDFAAHALLLIFVNAAMTCVCLGISSLMRSPDQASLLSIYLVGFQLPLSGAVLALPEKIEPFTRPFISAYWSWSGSMRTLEPGFLDAVKKVTSTTLSPAATCVFMLFLHIIAGVSFAWIGSHRNRWD